MNFAALFAILSQASQILSVIGLMRKQADPTVTNAAIVNSTALINMVTPLVQGAEALSDHGVAQGQPVMTGGEKLAVVLNTVQQVHQAAADAGKTSDSFDAVWAQVNPVITAICAASKPVSGANNLSTIMGS